MGEIQSKTCEGRELTRINWAQSEADEFAGADGAAQLVDAVPVQPSDDRSGFWAEI